MQLEFEFSGGYGGLFAREPARFSVNLDELPTTQREHLEILLRESGLLDADAKVPPKARSSRDAFSCRLVLRDGGRTRSFALDDASATAPVRGLLQELRTLAIAESDVAEPLNLGSSELVSIDRLVSIVEEIAGIELERFYNTDAPIGVAGRNSDNTRVLAELGWEPSVSLRDGMEKTYKWIHDAYLRRYAGHMGPRAQAPLGAHVQEHE